MVGLWWRRGPGLRRGRRPLLVHLPIWRRRLNILVPVGLCRTDVLPVLHRGLNRPVLLLMIRRPWHLVIRAIRLRSIWLRPIGLGLIRLVGAAGLLRVLLRSYRAAGWLRGLLPTQLIRIHPRLIAVRRRILVDSSLIRPTGYWIGAGHSTRNRLIRSIAWPLLLALLRRKMVRTLLPRTVWGGMGRSCDDRASRQLSDWRRGPDRRRDRSGTGFGNNLLALLIDEHRPVDRNRHGMRDGVSNDGARWRRYVRTSQRLQVLNLPRVDAYGDITHLAP